jgi:uncharacterized protein YbjT (DUF2867 family)
MIRATKYMDPATSVVGLAARIVYHLRGTRVLTFTELVERISAEVGPSSRVNMSHAASFLFLVGLIDYLPASDAVRLLKPEGNS